MILNTQICDSTVKKVSQIRNFLIPIISFNLSKNRILIHQIGKTLKDLTGISKYCLFQNPRSNIQLYRIIDHILPSSPMISQSEMII